MPEFLVGILYGTLAGLMIPVGGYLARIGRLQPEWLEQEFRHSVIAFNGGVLIPVVAFALFRAEKRYLLDSEPLDGFLRRAGRFQPLGSWTGTSQHGLV